jgi:hypothetical protein
MHPDATGQRHYVVATASPLQEIDEARKLCREMRANQAS